MERILVTGGAGYLGSVMSRKLISEGYKVRCFDRLYFGESSVGPLLKNKNFELIKGNLLNLDDFPNLLDGLGGVIHLAGLANDPTSELDPRLTDNVNYKLAYKLAEQAKSKDIRRFLFASSCSVYGKALVDIVNEDSPLNPVSIYAESKANAEREIMGLADDKFSPVCLRQATLYGVSPRMRIDLAVNLMVLHALSMGKIFVWGGGEQWRPFLHVEDAADAFIHCLELPVKRIAGKVYNLASGKDNYKIVDLAEAVKRRMKGVRLDITPDNPDKRSYRVDCSRIQRELNWRPKKNIEQGVDELIAYMKRAGAKEFSKPVYYNLKTLQKFLETPALKGGDPVRCDFLPFSLPSIGKEEEDEVLATLRSGWLTTGPKVQRLENMFRDYIGCKHAICVSSCTAALHLSLVALDIKKGDEVITSPVTWAATANVIVQTGATPVFADIVADTLNIDPDKIEKKITRRTKAIIPVHMAGQPCDMDKIHAIAKRHNLYVIEDAAHAIGARYRGRNIGTMSDFTCFSFYPIKNITTIEGGLITTRNSEWADKIRVHSLHGVSKDAWKRYSKEAKGHHELIVAGFKYNMTDMQASLGLHQLPKLDRFIKEREQIVRQYNNAFRPLKEISLVKSIKRIRHAQHLYIIMLNTERLAVSRDDFIQALKKENIGTGIHFRSLHIQPYYRKEYKRKGADLVNAEHISDRIISLPLYPAMNQYDVDSVIKAVKKLIAYYKR